MRLHLCVDGGGTKTRAVISDENGQILGSGEAGPSNLTFGVQQTVSAIIASTKQALSSLPSGSVVSTSCSDWPVTHGNSTADARPAVFAKVWVGIAGCARPPDFALLSPYIADLFPGSHWKLSNDGELLTSPALNTEYRQVVTAICGTGSLALRWTKQVDGSLKQVERSGGWGPLLGDEGSGWSLGREGVKSVLSFAANGKELRPFHRQIMTRLDVNDTNAILPSLMLLEDDGAKPSQAEVKRKGKIAGCTKHVVPAAVVGDEEALRILHKVAREVVDLLRPIEATLSAANGGSHDHADTMLIFGGGLSCVDIFRQAVLVKMAAENWLWGDVRVVADTAEDGVKSLSQRKSEQCTS